MRRTKIIKTKKQRIKVGKRLKAKKMRKPGNLTRRRKYNFGKKEEE